MSDLLLVNVDPRKDSTVKKKISCDGFYHVDMIITVNVAAASDWPVVGWSVGDIVGWVGWYDVGSLIETIIPSAQTSLDTVTEIW